MSGFTDTGEMPAGELAAGVQAGDHRSLARAITLAESTREDHRAAAEEVLSRVLDATGKSCRLGISGAPGVGKSTFITALGLHALEQGQKVAVLAIDPSSSRTGGSLLGDKTRMAELARNRNTFIRPSPTGGTLGGLARRTREALLLCEAAGFDTVMVETVGVGQSETAASDLVDVFCLLVAPGGGDELQGIKRGIMELADLVVVNKTDGEFTAASARAAADIEHALHLLRPKWQSWDQQVIKCSSLEAKGIDAVWHAVAEFMEAMTASGDLEQNRKRQAVAWLWSELRETLLDRFKSDPDIAARLPEAEARVAEGTVTPTVAARSLLGPNSEA